MTESLDAHRQKRNAEAAAEFESLLEKSAELLEAGQVDEAKAMRSSLKQAADRYFATLTAEERRARHGDPVEASDDAG